MTCSGLTAPQVAVVVIKEDVRPSIDPEWVRSKDERIKEFVQLMVSCWHRDPSIRPVFLDIMNRLYMLGEGEVGRLDDNESSSSTQRSTNNTSSVINSINSSSSESDLVHGSSQLMAEAQGRSRVPGMQTVCRFNVSFVVCDLVRMSDLWQSQPSKAAKTISSFIKIVRKHCATFRGFVFSRSNLHSGGTFMVAFTRPTAAVAFASAVLTDLCAKSRRARIGIHHQPGLSPSPKAGDVSSGINSAYRSDIIDTLCRIGLDCPPGAIICSTAFSEHLQKDPNSECSAFTSCGKGLFFIVSPPVEKADGDEEDKKKAKEKVDELEDDHAEEDNETESNEGLCSSNACPWVISSGSLEIGEFIGEGNYGSVSKALFRPAHVGSSSASMPIKVAVKRLFRSRLDDEGMLKLRKEAAILSSVEHPNVVRLIGLSITDSSLQLVTELLPSGNLRSLLSNENMSLSWQKRLSFLRDAALGISHLHSLGILHRDIKSSNLLVDVDGRVKVGDFGFATAKADNGTLTRCGTPSWTAPEILSPLPPAATGEEKKGTSDGTGIRYSEKADVYSFGIVMWEVLTRRVPYNDRNMMFVVVEVINGYRPKVPSDCPPMFGDLMQRCWHREPDQRPDLDEVVMFCNSELVV